MTLQLVTTEHLCESHTCLYHYAISLVPSCPRPLAENVWWFDLNFFSQRRVQQTNNYCQECNYQTCSLLAARLVV